MALRLEEGEKALAQLGGRAHAGRFYGAIENSLQNEVLCRRIRAGAAPCCVLGRTRTLRLGEYGCSLRPCLAPPSASRRRSVILKRVLSLRRRATSGTRGVQPASPSRVPAS